MRKSTTCTKRSWAGVLLAVLTALAAWGLAADAVAQGVPVDQASDEQKAQAREHFTKAKELFGQQKLAESLQAAHNSYDIVSSPNSRIMIAQVLDAMGKGGEAYAEAQAVEKEATAAAAADAKYEKTADAARQLMASIRPSIGMVSIKLPVSDDPYATLTVNGRDIPQSQWLKPIPVKAGDVVAKFAGFPAGRGKVEAGGEVTVDLSAKAGPAGPAGAASSAGSPGGAPDAAAPEQEPPDEDYGADSVNKGLVLQNRRTAAYIAGGVGALGMVLFAVFGSMAASTYSDIEDQCPGRLGCDPALREDANDGKNYQTAGNVSLAIGIAGLAAGAGLLIWDLADSPDEPDPAEGDEEVAGRDAQLVVGPGSIGLRGTF